MSDLARAALQYAQQGHAVFPLVPRGKIPIFQYVDHIPATNDEDEINDWWHKYPDANIGLSMGERNFVLDVDGNHGMRSLRKLEKEYGPLPQTATATTGSGRHLYFQAVPGIKDSVSSIGDSLDIRGNGGYTVAPPSIHENGKVYAWMNDAPIEQAPDWLIDLIFRSPTTEDELNMVNKAMDKKYERR